MWKRRGATCPTERESIQTADAGPEGFGGADLRYTYAVPIMRHRRQLSPLLAALAYLAAAVAPCPPSVDSLRAMSISLPVHSSAASDQAHGPSHGHHHPQTKSANSERAEVQPTSHHHEVRPDHPQEARELSGTVPSETTVAAPCPCGCGKRAGSVGIAKRLYPLVLSNANPTPVSSSARAQYWLIQWVPDSPPSLPDTVPIPT
jgi:hypothetical protein